METLDKQKLLEWLDSMADKQYYGAVYQRIIEIYKEIKSGRFDIQEEQTRSTLQNGDKVTHTKHKYLGTGIIIQFSKTGKTATVDFSQINDWDNKRFPSPPRSFNYLVEHLILVEEQTDEKS